MLRRKLKTILSRTPKGRESTTPEAPTETTRPVSDEEVAAVLGEKPLQSRIVEQPSFPNGGVGKFLGGAAARANHLVNSFVSALKQPSSHPNAPEGPFKNLPVTGLHGEPFALPRAGPFFP